MPITATDQPRTTKPDAPFYRAMHYIKRCVRLNAGRDKLQARRSDLPSHCQRCQSHACISCVHYIGKFADADLDDLTLVHPQQILPPAGLLRDPDQVPERWDGLG